MKLAIAILALTTTVAAQGILNSKHDFSTGEPWSNGEICSVCHSAHGASIDATYRTDSNLLWSRALSTDTWTVYGTASMGSTMGQPNNDPQGSSKLCLGCHDGSVALENFGATTGSTTNFISLSKQVPALTGSWGADHPITIDYTQANDMLPVGSLTFPGGTPISQYLNGNTVECASCHDVHDSQGNGKLLWILNTNSALCLACHDK